MSDLPRKKARGGAPIRPTAERREIAFYARDFGVKNAAEKYQLSRVRVREYCKAFRIELAPSRIPEPNVKTLSVLRELLKGKPSEDVKAQMGITWAELNSVIEASRKAGFEV